MSIPSSHDPLVYQDFRGAGLAGGSGGDGVSDGIGGRGGAINIHNTANQTNNYSMPAFVGTASEGLKVLYGRVATDAMHDSKDEYDRPKCHPATCKAIIDEIIDWVENDNLDYPFLWMNGPVGSGKSTIARTIAKILTSTGPHEGSFAASFFFRKTVPGRNNPTRLVATIAYQLTRHVPKVKKHIAVALEKEPFVFDQSYEDQMAKLVMGPLIRLADRSRIPLLPDFEALLDLIAGLFMRLINHPSTQDYSAGKRRRLVIIDGLDECGGLDSQVKILKLLFMAVQKAKFPLFFLIVSRPEHGIRTFFNEDRVNLLSRRLILDNEQYKLDDDIRSFLLSEFKDIRIKHPSGPSLPQIWPLESDVQQLVQKASGQFIYADTVMKFIKSHKTRPTTQLELILGMTPPDKSFTVLDDLYIRIFESAFGTDFVDNAKRALEVLSFLILRETGNILTIEDVEKFLGYEDGDVQILFNDLHSVVNVPLAGSDFSESAIHIYHTSLRDFLLDKNRAKGFFIDAIKSHALLAKQCIRHLSNSFDSETGFDTDNNILKISYFDLQHHHSVLFASRQSANSDLHAFDLGAYPNLAHHKDSVDLASHRFCLLLPFHDHIRYENESNQSDRQIYRKCLDALDQFLHDMHPGNAALQFLYQHALDVSYSSPLHSEQTLVTEILDWARSGIEAPQFFWMYGSPGAGKTSSSRSITQMLINDGKVVASFFFSRSVSARKNAFRLVATIAYQLSTVIPEICAPMALAIAREPTIFSRSLSIQLDTLIVSPLAHIAQLPNSKNLPKTTPQFIVLDGLDECEDMNSILELLSGIASKSQLPLVKFLITSRQELEIQNFFNEPTISPSSLRCSLDDRYRWNAKVQSQTQGAQQQTMLGILQQHIAPMAIYNSSERFNAPRCLPGTRTHIISEILYWADNDSKKYPFLWIYGPAGTGKSCVSQTIAEILFERGKLSASHFFSRVRMDATRFVATAAYQLSLSIPAFREPLANAIENDPTIFSKSIQAQFESLIVEPFMHLSKDNDQRSSTNATAGIIIIDALDECDDSENQNIILSVLFNAIQRSVLPLSFMISSRPEYSTRAFFDQVEVHSLTRRINLHIETRLEEDIEMFLRSEFKNIRETHPTKSSLQDWPSDTAIKQLVLKSSGQFIYASSVMKFIQSPRRRPTEQLDIILGLRPSGNQAPFASLDSLYTHLLSSIDDWERVAPVLGVILKESDRSALGDIAQSLHMEMDELQMLLANLHTILYVPPIDQPLEKIHLYHASLADFLRDRSRSGPFFIGI